jgi:glycosyltransferase involved in cell wall biosynthesis
MRILHLIDSGGLYGAEVMLINLALEQKRLGAQPVIGSIRNIGICEKPIEIEARKKGLVVQTFDMKSGFNLFGIIKIIQYAKKEKFDIFHSHGYKSNILIGLTPAFIRTIPIVCTLHGWTSTERWSKMRFNEKLDAFALNYVDKIILVSKEMLYRSELEKIPLNKKVVINNGIAIEDSIPKTVDRNETLLRYISNQELLHKLRQFINDMPVVASIGRLSSEKGYLYLIEAVRLLHEVHGIRVKLLLIGEGEDRNKLEKLVVNANLSDYCFFTGYVKNANRLLPLIDYYVISSLSEGLPITLLEAMAAETPIIATEVGAIPHVLVNNEDALLVRPKDPEAIALAIKKLIVDPDTSSILKVNSRNKVTQFYSSKLMAKEYLKVYSSVLAQI